MPRPKDNRIEKFFNSFLPEPNSGCWLWMERVDVSGYGIVFNGRGLSPVNFKAHRFAYELLRGPIPAGLQLDHLCRVRCCVNPAHLEPVTLQENLRRGTVLITHCPAGHAYDSDNVYWMKNGARACVQCRRDRSREYQRRRLGIVRHVS